jgi:hypothetical protein
MACVVDKEPPTQFAPDTYVRMTVSIISPFGGQKGDETTHSERFGEVFCSSKSEMSRFELVTISFDDMNIWCND